MPTQGPRATGMLSMGTLPGCRCTLRLEFLSGMSRRARPQAALSPRRRAGSSGGRGRWAATAPAAWSLATRRRRPRAGTPGPGRAWAGGPGPGAWALRPLGMRGQGSIDRPCRGRRASRPIQQRRRLRVGGTVAARVRAGQPACARHWQRLSVKIKCTLNIAQQRQAGPHGSGPTAFGIRRVRACLRLRVPARARVYIMMSSRRSVLVQKKVGE